MHLQNKHLAELIKIESQVALDDNNKTKIMKKPVKLKPDIQLGIEEASTSNGEFYVSEEPPQLFHLDGNDIEDNYVYSPVSRKMVYILSL